MAISYKLLSYVIDNQTHAYGGGKPFNVKPDKRLCKGDSCNTFILSFPNHIGTHIESPGHFYQTGKKICRYSVKDFIFSQPFLLDCPKPGNGLITEADIRKNFHMLEKADLLLLRTGFHRYRGSYKYSMENPGISPEAACFIRTKLGNIRCVGIDCVSISPYKNRALGRESHRIFFNSDFRNKPVCLIEDMDLSGRIRDLKKVYAMPLFIKGIDSFPCTVIGV